MGAPSRAGRGVLHIRAAHCQGAACSEPSGFIKASPSPPPRLQVARRPGSGRFTGQLGYSRPSVLADRTRRKRGAWRGLKAARPLAWIVQQVGTQRKADGEETASPFLRQSLLTIFHWNALGREWGMGHPPLPFKSRPPRQSELFFPWNLCPGSLVKTSEPTLFGSALACKMTAWEAEAISTPPHGAR